MWLLAMINHVINSFVCVCVCGEGGGCHKMLSWYMKDNIYILLFIPFRI